MSPFARALRWFVRAYQNVRAGRPSPCRFQPSCSAYAVEALELHGALRGSWLAFRRICRCNPFGGQGWDPVPHPDDCVAERRDPHDHHHHERMIA